VYTIVLVSCAAGDRNHESCSVNVSTMHECAAVWSLWQQIQALLQLLRSCTASGSSV
jgi:hypothetical protein